MTQEGWLVVKSMSWVVTCGLCWKYAALFSSAGWDWWFWAVAFAIDLMVLGAAVAAYFGGL